MTETKLGSARRLDSTGSAVVGSSELTPLPHPDFPNGKKMILGNINSGTTTVGILRPGAGWTHAAELPMFPKETRDAD